MADPALELRGVERLTPRLSELLAFSPALERETRVRILTPPAFDPRSDPLPVLYLFHGGGLDSDQTNWTVKGDAEALTDGLPLVVVMPDGGKGGWYMDWRTPKTAHGPQRWESYHVGELMPFVSAQYATRTDRAGTAVVGLSMGGFGAMHYAARHPDRFGFAASFSGALDLLHPGVARTVGASPLVMGGERGDILGRRDDYEAFARAPTTRLTSRPTWRLSNCSCAPATVRPAARSAIIPMATTSRRSACRKPPRRCIGDLTSSASRTCTTPTGRGRTRGRTGTARWRRRCRASAPAPTSAHFQL